MLSWGMCLCSGFQFVSRVVVDLAGARSLFVENQFCSVLRKGCRRLAAVFASLCVLVRVMSSAYEAMCIWGVWGLGKSCM